MTEDKPKREPGTTPCWYVKDLADGWIKFYDIDSAAKEAMMTGAIMRYSITGKAPEMSAENSRLKTQLSRACIALRIKGENNLADDIYKKSLEP